MACATCSKRVLSHAYSIQCHYCETSYHMKCISLEAEFISQLKESHENWLCCTCIKYLFPYNQLEDDDFSQAILMKLENELKISNLIYNPHESTHLTTTIAQNLIQMWTSSANKICFRDMHAYITMKIAWMIKWAHFLVMKSIFPYVI